MVLRQSAAHIRLSGCSVTSPGVFSGKATRKHLRELRRTSGDSEVICGFCMIRCGKSPRNPTSSESHAPRFSINLAAHATGEYDSIKDRPCAHVLKTPAP